MKKLFIYLMTWMCISAANAAGFSMFADRIIWQASEQTASIWAADIPFPTPTNNELAFAPKNITFSWSQGYKVGFLYEPDNFLDTKLYWTYYPTSATTNYSPGAQVIFPEFFSGYISGNYFFGANLHWQFELNTLDLQLSHKFNVADSISLRPSIGIKGATIDQSIDATWEAVVYTATEQVEHDFSGIGPSIGLDAKWNFYGNFSAIGDIYTAFLWSNWNITDTYKRPSVPLIVSQTTINTSMNNSTLGTLMLDYILGIEWVHKGRSQITVQLGYEMQYWANQLRMPVFQQLPVRGDLTLQGATCGIYIDF